MVLLGKFSPFQNNKILSASVSMLKLNPPVNLNYISLLAVHSPLMFLLSISKIIPSILSFNSLL